MPIATLDEIRARVGQEIGVSDWLVVDQNRIDHFADVTEDRQFIHVDPASAALTPLGGTVAHGFLTLSLLTCMAADVVLHPEPMRMGLNYGLDRVRFVAPVRAGKRIRGRFALAEAIERRPGEWRFVHSAVVEIEGEDKPALTADWIGLIIV